MENLWIASEKLHLGRLDGEIDIPYSDYIRAQERNALSILAKSLNPQEQNLLEMAEELTRTWEMESRVRGRAIKGELVQFLFHDDIDLVSVLRREPVIFNHWPVTLQLWNQFGIKHTYSESYYGSKFKESRFRLLIKRLSIPS